MRLSLVISFLLIASKVFPQDPPGQHIPKQPYSKYEWATSTDTVIFYLSETNSKEELPLVIFIQGSGMHSVFSDRGGKIVPEYGHMSWYDIAKERYRVLLIEKPGVKYLQAGESLVFDKKFSLETWSNTIVAAINYALQHEKINANKVLIAGHSEGGVVAARVAHLIGNKLSHVAIMAGEGPSQLYSLFTFAEDGTFFNTKEHNLPTAKSRIEYLENKWKEIEADPGSTTKKFWGFTYLRWSGMLKTSVIDELSSYAGKIMLVQGTADKAVYPESASIAYNSLLSKGRNIILELVPGADHSFNITDQPATDGWTLIIQKLADWFLSN